MPIVQEAFDIPANIAAKILTGEYRRIGGVVRHAIGPNKGQIVKHLEPVNLKVAQEAQGVAAKALQFAKNNKKTLIVVGIGTGIAAAGAGIYYKIKNTEPVVLKQFKFAFREYLNAIRAGKLSEEIIDTMMITLENLKSHKDYEKLQIQLSEEDLNTIVCKVYEYTKKLAEDNNVELDSKNPFEDTSDTDTIIALEHYLNLQKDIFSAVA